MLVILVGAFSLTSHAQLSVVRGQYSRIDTVLFQDSSQIMPYPYAGHFYARGVAGQELIDGFLGLRAPDSAGHTDYFPDSWPNFYVISQAGDTISLAKFMDSICVAITEGSSAALRLRVDWTGAIWYVELVGRGKIPLEQILELSRRLRAAPAMVDGFPVPFAVTLPLRQPLNPK